MVMYVILKTLFHASLKSVLPICVLDVFEMRYFRPFGFMDRVGETYIQVDADLPSQSNEIVRPHKYHRIDPNTITEP